MRDSMEGEGQPSGSDDHLGSAVLKTDDAQHRDLLKRGHSFPRSHSGPSQFFKIMVEPKRDDRGTACALRDAKGLADGGRHWGAFVGQEFPVWFLCNQGVRHGLRLSATRLDVLANSRKYLYLDCEPFRQVLQDAVRVLGLQDVHSAAFSNTYLPLLEGGDLGAIKHTLRKCYTGIARIRDLLVEYVNTLVQSGGPICLRLPHARRLLQMVRRKLLADLSQLMKVTRTVELLVLRSISAMGRKGRALIRCSGRSFLLSLDDSDLRLAFSWLQGRKQYFSGARGCGMSTVQCIHIVRRLGGEQVPAASLLNCFTGLLRPPTRSSKMSISFTGEDSCSTRFGSPPTSFKLTDYVNEEPLEDTNDAGGCKLQSKHVHTIRCEGAEATQGAMISRISKLLTEYLRIRAC